MADRTAIVTGASSGIGLAISAVLAQEGHEVTMVARTPEKLQAAAEGLQAKGLPVVALAANVGDEQEIQRVVAEHRERCGRLDVLVNNAGVGAGALVSDITAKRIDLQVSVNLRAVILFYREALPMLRAAAAEHRAALVVNTSSISGKHGEPWLSVYSATKHGVVGWTEAMNGELGAEGIKSTALCPAWVDTEMADFVKGFVKAEDMIRSEDIAEAVRFLLRLSPRCVVPEIMFTMPETDLAGAREVTARANDTKGA